MKETAISKCERIYRLFNNGSTGGQVTSVNGQTGDVVVDVPVTSVNGEIGDVNVVTCNPFPEGTVTGVGVEGGVSTVDFCNSLANNQVVVTGMMYLGPVYIAEGAKDPWVSPYGRVLADAAEVTVKVLKCTRSVNHVNIVMVLEMTSTNQGPRHWMTIYEKNGSTTDASSKGQLMFGSDTYPWFGMLYSPLDNSTKNPLADRFVAASKKDVTDSVQNKVDKETGKSLISTSDITKLAGIEAGAQVNTVKSVTVNGTGNAVTNATVTDGAVVLTKGNVGASEATAAEVQAGTSTTSMVTPNMTSSSVKFGLIHNSTQTAGGTSLMSTEQASIQSWLGTNELTFVIDNGNGTTSERKFKFVCTEITENT